MGERLSRWGIGPRIAASVIAYSGIAGLFTVIFPGACRFAPLHHQAVVTFAGTLVVIGVVMWVLAAVSVMRAYNRDQLVTTGLFAVVRHPLYSAWIVLILPGLALLTGSWPFLLAPLVGYVAFKRLIHREDEYLRKRFGQSYVDYSLRVNEIIPIPRLRHRHAPIQQ
jgi:protein-S-isoprenylcysteine O-methyltransferase Ste14